MKKETELKGSRTGFPVKRYFYGKVEGLDFELYSIILSKRRLSGDLRQDPERLYNFLAGLITAAIPWGQARIKIILTVHKRKRGAEIESFNRLLFDHIRERTTIPVEIYHRRSAEAKGIQVVDTYSWGIFRKYEIGDDEWYNVFN